MLSNTLRLNFCYLKIIHILYPKIIGHILGNQQKKKCICIYGIIRLIMKMKMKMKNGSHRYDTNRPRSRHGHKYSKYKKSLTIMMLTCIKQHLRNMKPFLKMEKEHAYVVFIYLKFFMKFLQILHGQLSGAHCLILCLKIFRLSNFFILFLVSFPITITATWNLGLLSNLS